MKKLLALAGLAALAVSAPAAAATFTTAVQTISFGTHTTEFDPTTQSYASQAFQLFDSSLGTLLGMTVEATYSENTNLTLTNTGSTPATGSIYTTSTLYMDASDANQDSVFQNIIPGLAAVGTTTCFGTRGCANAAIGGNSSISVSSNSGLVDTQQITDQNVNDLAYFQAAGGGVAQVLASTQSLTTLSTTNSNLNFTQATTGTPTFKIFYTYSTAAVPEPATWAMMIAGFGMVGLGMRRKGSAPLFG